MQHQARPYAAEEWRQRIDDRLRTDRWDQTLHLVYCRSVPPTLERAENMRTDACIGVRCDVQSDTRSTISPAELLIVIPPPSPPPLLSPRHTMLHTACAGSRAAVSGCGGNYLSLTYSVPSLRRSQLHVVHFTVPALSAPVRAFKRVDPGMYTASPPGPRIERCMSSL